jgi:hypothetical protein
VKHSCVGLRNANSNWRAKPAERYSEI